MRAPREWMPTSATRLAAVVLDDLVGDAHERASQVVPVEDCACLKAACPFLASLDRVKGTDARV